MRSRVLSDMAAAITKGIELFDIAEPQAGLCFHPGAQANLECAMAERIEGPKGKAGARFALSCIGCDEGSGLVFHSGDNRRGKADFECWMFGFGHCVASHGAKKLISNQGKKDRP